MNAVEKDTKIIEMSNNEYRKELNRLFQKIDDNKMLRYFYIFVLEKSKRV